MNFVTINDSIKMRALCAEAKSLILNKNFEGCTDLLTEAMAQYPHAPEPHNLIGVLLEKMGDHKLAMKHFRAAWALDPSYAPARQNLECFGTFYSRGKCAFDESDCCPEAHTDSLTAHSRARA